MTKPSAQNSTPTQLDFTHTGFSPPGRERQSIVLECGRNLQLNSNNAIQPSKRSLVENSQRTVLGRQASLGLVFADPHGLVVVGYVD